MLVEIFNGHTFRHTFVTSDKSSIDIEKIVPQNKSNIVDIKRKMA